MRKLMSLLFQKVISLGVQLKQLHTHFKLTKIQRLIRNVTFRFIS